VGWPEATRESGHGRPAGGRKTKLTAQAHLIERREGGGQLGRREPKGKMYFREDATDAWARWAGQGGFDPREERFRPAGAAGAAGWLGQRPSGP
jgi:hypothetical protein